MFACALHMPVSTHTYATYTAHTSVGGALVDAADGASAALAARQAAPCQPCVRDDTAGANAPTGGVSPNANGRSAAVGSQPITADGHGSEVTAMSAAGSLRRLRNGTAAILHRCLARAVHVRQSCAERA